MIARMPCALVFAFSILTLPACVRLGRERPEKRFYMIEAVRPARAGNAAGAGPRAGAEGLLHVRRIGIAAAYESPSFVYRTAESAWESDYYNTFFIPPDAMLADQITRWMEGTGLFRRVTSAGSQMRGEFLLEGSVLSLYGDYRSAAPEAVMEIELVLLYDTPEGLTMLHHETYTARESLEGSGPEGLVAAWSRAFSGIMQEAEADFARALATGAAAADDQQGD